MADLNEETVALLARRLHEQDKDDRWDDAGCNDDAGGAMVSCKERYLERARTYLATCDSS